LTSQPSIIINKNIKSTVLICSSKKPHYPNYSNDCAASTRCRNQPQKAGKEEVAIVARWTRDGEIRVDDREREELPLLLPKKIFPAV
jgi:hypothetical protein